ncbi:MAG TPA: P1 family peptidase, partial [Thermoplasmata archaeon]|nr:P1 family peptidase [Thermoplasmata archaeon]
RRGTVGVLVVVNSLGAVRDPSTGRWVAGARDERRAIIPPGNEVTRGAITTTGTTLGLVATDVKVDRPTLARAVAMAHAGLASVVTPFHSATDGDVLFGAATGRSGTPPLERRPGETADQLGVLAAHLVARATIGAVRIANAHE